jgi:monovalent cation/proton antiporter MnhG/PhaG subunit
VNAQGIAVDVLLAAAVVLQLACVVGVVVMPHVYDRLHFLTPATSVAPWFVAAAVWIREEMNHAGVMAFLVAAFLLVFQPVLSHATARAARLRERGDWRERPEETVHR